jgi:hypothetical protein
MKKVKYLLFAVIMFVSLIGTSYAANLGVSASTKSAVVGNTISVTVSASGAAGWEYCLNYDSSVFRLTSAGSDTGGACVKTGSTLIGYSKVTFKFKAIKSGTGTFSLRDAVMYGDDGNPLSSSKGSVTVTARTQAEIQASYSANADLKSLGVDGFEITPAFNKNTLEYALTVENNVTSVNVSALRADNTASVSGAGTIQLSEGLNVVTIVVTAQKGNQKKYVINIERKELDPINVSVDNVSYTVVRKAELLEIPTYYEASTITIDGEEVPALYSEITKYTLVGLKDEDGKIELYRYLGDADYKDMAPNMFERYYQFNTEVISFVPVTVEDKIYGYESTKKIDINDEKIDVYYNKDNKDYVLIYGMNMTTGNEGWYQYDIKENTFQRYVENNLKEIEEDKELYFLLLCIAGGACALSLLLMLVLGINNSKMKKKNKKMLIMLEELNNRVKGKDVTNDETKEKKEESLVKEENEEVPEVKKTRNKKVKKEN